MIEIDKRKIGLGYPPYIIAELSANHNGSLDKAKLTIKKAKESGANAIKLQTYTADSMTIKSNKDDFKIKEGLWNGYSLYELYEEASTPYEWHKELFNYAKKIDISIFSTPFDEEAVDILERLDAPAFKIASFELVDLPLIKYVASKGKPILISTGMGTLEEIEEAVNTCINAGNSKILLFHCISSYPASSKESNVKVIPYLRNKFNLEVGLSDHTINNISSLTAISLGATAIEKHFILDRKEIGPDSTFSIEPGELRELVEESKECWQSLGNVTFKRSNSEVRNKIFRRSLYFVKDLKENDTITAEHIRRIRPGYGLPPKYFDQIINKKVNREVRRGDRVDWKLIQLNE